MKKAVIIVAGGSGTRMGSAIPKQFMLMNSRPVLMHTFQRFHDYDPKIFFMLVLPENEIGNWRDLVSRYAFPITHTIVNGGKTRFDSVKNGLERITWPCVVAIHDGVRPLSSVSLIARCFDDAGKYSNAIPAILVNETIREVSGKTKSVLIDRNKLRIIQTPQCFDSEKLKRAYLSVKGNDFTDDAGVFEKAGNKIHLVEGERNNIKITLPEDLQIASSLEKTMFHRVS